MKRTRTATEILNCKKSCYSNEISELKENKEEKSNSSELKNQQDKEITEKIEKKESIKTAEDLQFMRELQQLQHPPLMFEDILSSKRLPLSFYDTPCETLAQNLLGKILVRKLDNGRILKGRIVETESYLGFVDKASATYEGKVTLDNIPTYMNPGTIFVYIKYGNYVCFNISSQGLGSSVFIRAIEPVQGIDQMKKHRSLKAQSKILALCNGPSKLCMAFDIKKEHSEFSLCTWKGMWIEDDPNEDNISIVHTTRIGIDITALEWVYMPLRFYILGNRSVSKRDEKAESKFFP